MHLSPGENHVGEIGGNSALITVTPTVSTTPAYTAGDAVGGKQTLAAMRFTEGTAVLESLHVLDTSNQKAALEVLIFGADPTAATITDNAAFVFSTDNVKVIARIPIATTDYVTINSQAVATLRGLGVVLKATVGLNIYAAIVAIGTPTYASTSALQLTYGLLRD